MIREHQQKTNKLKNMLIEVVTNSIEENHVSYLQQWWQSNVSLVEDISLILTKKLPEFYRITKSLLDEHAIMSNTISTAFSNVYLNIVSVYIGILQEVFPEKSGQGYTYGALQDFILEDDSISSSYYLLQILAQLVDTFNDIKLFKMPSEVLMNFATLIHQVKTNFIYMISSSAYYESSRFHDHENFTSDPDPLEVTACVRLFYRYVKYICRSLYIISTTRVIVGSVRTERIYDCRKK
jgi:hypothetical protein